MATFTGTGILFAVGDVTHTISGIAAFNLALLQSVDYNEESDKEEIKDSVGNTKSVAYYDRKAKATLEFVPNTGTNTGTVTITTWPTIGTTITITDAIFAPIGAAWIVDGLNLTRSNTKALMARINLARYIDGAIP
jgi:hypothetical protein